MLRARPEHTLTLPFTSLIVLSWQDGQLEEELRLRDRSRNGERNGASRMFALFKRGRHHPSTIIRHLQPVLRTNDSSLTS